MRDWEWDDIAFAALVILVVGFFVVWAVIDHNARRKCTDNGGHVVEHNCRWVTGMQSCGSNCWYPYTYQHCDWRCEGANAEDAR